MWEAQRFETGWDWTVSDPADEWVEALDRRAGTVVRIWEALRRPTKRQRFAALDKLLGTFSDDGDAGFMSLVMEWVCDQAPDYQLHCEAQVGRIHQRGHRAASRAVTRAA